MLKRCWEKLPASELDAAAKSELSLTGDAPDSSLVSTALGLASLLGCRLSGVSGTYSAGREVANLGVRGSMRSR